MSVARRVLPEAPSRRGWCPSLARPMQTGDGLLARVHPPLGRLTAAQARAVAAGARRFGNGHVDVTARANLQIRGVTPETQGPLARHLMAVGLGDVRADGGPQRLTLTAPLFDLDTLAEAVEALGRAVPGLPPKTLVAIEDGGRFGLGEADADIHLRVVAPHGVAWALAGPDGPVWSAPVPPAQVLARVSHCLHALAESGVRRMRDLDAAHRDRLVGAPMPAPTPIQPMAPGLHDFGDGRTALAVEAAFGRCTADGLDRLADWTERLASPHLALGQTRGFVLVTREREGARMVLDALGGQGFIHAADDPRGHVAACPGAPACASGSTPTLDDAARLAEALRGTGIDAHVSGCAKGCAHPGPAALTLVGRAGRYGIVLHGRPDGEPAMQLTFEAALDRVRRADSAGTLDRAFALDQAFRTPIP
ncbi:precorrin-3B synthase [Methylobacterium sp. J-090]|uniref:precorrin-3B synthase n=1 Tax=Methylobacterium sp. J-090 TaxID=2836666 RepID=UPI001FBA204F|nr:precorrin-3B synthase [Methylobacterium sp. J-090]MCJ2080464.1 precorrin-3B synthase [Methylobacterium sp. J-090]